MIPLNSLKFKKGLTTWGVNFGRIIRSGFETVYWTGPLTQDFRISPNTSLNGTINPDFATVEADQSLICV
jgi:hypothetical protein